MTELTDNFIQLVIVCVCGVCCAVSAIREKNRDWMFLALFYVSFGIGLLYWILYMILFSSTPRIFCVSELSWTASYVFLIIRILSDAETARDSKVGVFPWCFPLFSLLMCIIFCQRGSYFENILMGGTLGMCGYFAARGLCFAKKSGARQKGIFCAAALFFYAAEYLLWISSYLTADAGVMDPYMIVDTFVLNPALFSMMLAQRVRPADRKSSKAA